MRTTDLQSCARRRGFTLIEMLVVMGILLILATMVVAVVGSPILVQDKARRGGDQLQLWFRVAKSRAVADGAPRGLRLIQDPDGFVRQLQYIEQPVDFLANVQPSPPDPAGTPWQPNPIVVSNAGGMITATLQKGSLGQGDFTGGLNILTLQDDPSWPVQGDKIVNLPTGPVTQPGDYLEIQGGGLLHRILQVFPDHLVLASAPPNLPANSSLAQTSQWRVIRQPRVLKGETPLLLPQDIGIDIANCSPPPSAAGTSDILFAPSGRVLGQLGAQDRVVLWVCDTTRDATVVTPNFTRNGTGSPYATNRVYYQNNPMLVSIHSRTGFIAVHPVDTSNTPTNDFSFTLDGRLSGL